MNREYDDATMVPAFEEPQAVAPIFRVEIHLYSGKTITFDATIFKMDRKGAAVTGFEWEFAPSMLQPGVRRPLLQLLDPSRIEAVEYTELSP